MTYTKTITSLFFLCLFSIFLFSQSACAVTLKEAKGSGLVGERSNGYAGIVGHASPEVQKLVQSINQKRRAKYQSIAQANSTTLQAVESMAGKKSQQKTSKGQYIQKQGVWVKK
ncbi:MAG: YdbL family protein [Mariprofundaceae bacterium]|nr:YdbL family protein [Mariprofundaceae bacterium]